MTASPPTTAAQSIRITDLQVRGAAVALGS